MSGPVGIHLVAVPLTVPAAFHSRWYKVTATCPHGEDEHRVIVSPSRSALNSLPYVAEAHCRAMPCDCPAVEYLIKTEPEDASLLPDQ